MPRPHPPRHANLRPKMVVVVCELIARIKDNRQLIVASYIDLMSPIFIPLKC